MRFYFRSQRGHFAVKEDTNIRVKGGRRTKRPELRALSKLGITSAIAEVLSSR